MIRALLRWLKSFVAALWILVFVFCAAEVGLRLYEARHGPAAVLNSIGAEPHSSGTVEGGDLAEISRRSWFVHHGLQPSRSIRVKNPDTGAEVEVRTNGFGTRGAPVAVPKPPRVYRILCLGDEQVLGADVDESETACARLQAYLQSQAPMQIEVINAGIPGYCPLLSFLQYRHELAALQPDLTLLHVEMGDIADDHAVRRHALMNGGGIPTACPHPDLLSGEGGTGHRIKEPLLLMQRARQWYTAARFEGAGARDDDDIDLPQGRHAWIKPDGPDWSLHIEQALAPIVQLDQLTDAQFSRLIVVLSPAPWQISPTACDAATRRAAGVPEGGHYSDTRPFDLLGAFLTARKVPYCDVSPAFRAAPDRDSLFLSRAPRYSAAGHDLHARALAAWILRNVPAAWNADESGL